MVRGGETGMVRGTGGGMPSFSLSSGLFVGPPSLGAAVDRAGGYWWEHWPIVGAVPKALRLGTRLRPYTFLT